MALTARGRLGVLCVCVCVCVCVCAEKMATSLKYSYSLDCSHGLRCLRNQCLLGIRDTVRE